MERGIVDLAIIGSGPAGLCAAVYGTRAGLETLVVTDGSAGGQIATTDVVDNYPGIENVGGLELGQRMWDHAEHLGARFAFDRIGAISRDDSDGGFTLSGDDGAYRARTVIYAGGATPRRAGFAGEDEYRGRGVSYCATCDGMFYRGKDVYVIGGGNTACEEALYLSKLAASVTLVVRKDHLRAMKSLRDSVADSPNIIVRYLSRILSVSGDGLLSSLELESLDDEGSPTVEHIEKEPGSFGIFVSVGQEPQTELVQEFVDLDGHGYIQTDRSMATKTPGLYCAGDVRVTPLRQVITAAADGAVAATSAARFLGVLGE